MISKQEKAFDKAEKLKVAKAKPVTREETENLIRILSTDIPTSKNVYTGLTRIKGISWSFSNAICNVLGIDKNKKIADLTAVEIEKITEFVKKPEVPEFILNRRKDFDTGKNEHLLGSDLDLRRDFDIKRLKKIKSYRGIRHVTGQPVRGQRTKSHFRKNKAIGVMTKAKPGKKG